MEHYKNSDQPGFKIHVISLNILCRQRARGIIINTPYASGAALILTMVDFKSGDNVVHSLFGPGVVRTVAGAGLDARVTVDFSSSVGQKKLLAGVANLKRIAIPA